MLNELNSFLLFLLSMMAAVFVPIAGGWLVGRFFTVRNKWAERHDSWSMVLLLIAALVAVCTIIVMFIVGDDVEHPVLILKIGWSLITALLFTASFMRWTNKLP